MDERFVWTYNAMKCIGQTITTILAASVEKNQQYRSVGNIQHAQIIANSALVFK